MTTMRVPKDEYVQCTAMVTPSAKGRRCREPSMPDTDPPRCYKHFQEEGSKSRNTMHKFYRATMRPAIYEAIREQIDTVPLVERLDLSAEVELIRHSAANAVKSYSEVADTPGVSADALLLAGQLMTSALQDVSRMTESMARVEEVKAKVAGSFAFAVQQVVHAVVQAASDVFQNDWRVRVFEERIRELLEVKPNVLGVEGTTLTPDQDVTAMDDTVPSEAETAT